MKKVPFTKMALIAFTIFSCSEDGVNNDNNPVIADEETHSAVSLSFPKTTVFKSMKAHDIAAANGIETKVTSVGFYVVDEINNMMHGKVFSDSEFVQDNDDTNKYMLKSTLKTTTGQKRVFVVLNPGSSLQASIDNIRGGIFGEIPLDGVASDYVTASDLVMSSITATPATLGVMTEQEALDNPIPVIVQRNTAKVAVKEKAASTPVVGGTISDLGFAIVTEAKKSYLIQQGGNTLATVVTPGRNLSPVEAENAYFTKLSTPSSWKNVNASSTGNNSLEGYYAMENVNVKNVMGNTTAAIIKGQFTPENSSVVVAYSANDNRTLGSITSGESFYIKKSDYTFWSEDAYTDAIDADLTENHFSRIYKDGVCYYRVWIQDSEGKRGVLRNTYYVLNITKISGAGLPYVPGVDPENPDEPENPDQPIEEDTLISVEITVLPWDVQESEHEI